MSFKVKQKTFICSKFKNIKMLSNLIHSRKNVNPNNWFDSLNNFNSYNNTDSNLLRSTSNNKKRNEKLKNVCWSI
ncbi:hypothetical protein DR089_03915 [Mycoplasma hyorhinis]|nr:hypothetical protein [Mesomycoplasma hyorhinis]MXR08350.1 hypothetical protein [Mesomycoplasma hyorhinis]MXR09829.1 hypothetical protein [Mesomycoplasma hyorhinis]MXR58363.1 hypothetical protein [Mesomycoplasma hyorhinis]